MNVSALKNELGGMDLSLFDQLLKGRFIAQSKVLDAGCGTGRNSFWFINNGFDVYGIDRNEKSVLQLRNKIDQQRKNSENFIVGKISMMPWGDNTFNVVICNAVLHFATNQEHFIAMFSELVRVLQTGGVLFIRMTSDIGIEHRLTESRDGVYLIPDGSRRFLLTRELLADVMQQYNLKFVETLKTVNVNDIRCMTTLVLSKQ